MNNKTKTCGNCAHCIETSAGIDICSVDNTDVMGIEFESDIVARECSNYEPKPEMTTFKVPVVWTMMGFVDVSLPTEEHPTMADAIQYARKNIDEFSLPSGEYLDGSFEIDESACDLDNEDRAQMARMTQTIDEQVEKIYLERQHKEDVEEVFDYAEWDRHGEFADNVGYAFSPDREDFLLTDKEIDELATKIRANRNRGDSFESAYEYEVELLINKKKEHHEADVNAVKEYLSANVPGYNIVIEDSGVECIAYRTRYFIDNDGMDYFTAVPAALEWFVNTYGKDGENW